MKASQPASFRLMDVVYTLDLIVMVMVVVLTSNTLTLTLIRPEKLPIESF